MDIVVSGQQHGLHLRYLKQDVLGFVVYTDERVQGELYHEALTVIRKDLEEIVRILPQTVIQRILSSPIQIWVNLNNGAGKKGCCCHCIDLPAEYMACKFHSVEIFDIKDFLQQTQVQPAQLLHEFSHWLHHDIIREEQQSQELEGPWRASPGEIRAPSDHFNNFSAADDTLLYQMSNFQNHCLNGNFVLDKSSPKTGRTLDYSDLTLVQRDRTKFNQRVICRCTDRWSTMDSKCPDRWHLEIDGQVLAYRLGIDFGMKVAGWFEWINGQWRSTNGTAEASPSDVKTVLLVDGFRQAFLNGDYVAKTSLDWYRRHARCSQDSGSSRIWVNQRFTGHETMLRFTNMFSHVSDAEAPFDRWHLETRGFGCNAYLCDVDPTAKDAKGKWKEAIFSPTDQLIFEAYVSSLPLYTRSCQRVGRDACEAHYAATNHKEYFAECSEAYFSTKRFRNDYFPYIHEELKAYDPVGYAMCEKIWGPRTVEDEVESRYLSEFWPKSKSDGSASSLLATTDGKRKFLALVDGAARSRRQQVLGLST
ncbi:unnamed protein product [Cladocopium goreaui]|uniref:EF-hand domain-containing protein n=1 Tax=Cladocopium goreaui TaxID=2562237 RepID=A0A9P1G3E7_9DINO|nr:unnamed protein product [Cladocopium goreaui]